MLLNLAESVGLDKNEIEVYLATGEPFEVVQKSLKDVKKYGINGVPAFIIEDRLIYGRQIRDLQAISILNELLLTLSQI